MDPTIPINEVVDVVPIFRGRNPDLALCMPWKMVYGIHEIEFKTLGMRHPTVKGKRMIHVFDMSDGVNDYRLEFDAERLIWKLISMVEGHDVRD
ncbi:hypothetical protein H7100_01315 [Candidatus Saccharibacteria bacterium]|nr:hypothetical protein [Candidatus Saccharibacteria bacterium]